MGVKDTLRVMVVDDMATSRGLITQALDDLSITNYVIPRLPENPKFLMSDDPEAI